MACRTSAIGEKATGPRFVEDSGSGHEDCAGPAPGLVSRKQVSDAIPESTFDIYNAAEALSQLRENSNLSANGRARRRGRPRRTFRSPTPYGPTGPNRRWKRFEAAPGLRLELTRTDLELGTGAGARCPLPCCGREFGSRQALAAHLRHFPSHRVFYNENVGHRYGNSRVRIRYISASEVQQASARAGTPFSGDECAKSDALPLSSEAQRLLEESPAQRATIPARVLGNLTNIAGHQVDSKKGRCLNLNAHDGPSQ
ncbi:hypothetical protein F1559_004681 [Cyanidiococcus yangmingshanensis]|uniref:C2H2-type domain-containing protein n=1 Tax=Cyanidiococcus yangmingshanensis TaxID=2690220 RepID=A0A7J7IPM2_9RHOD|nr:hypothetical protein F1559_004681 [Cyanidiococcus yangmingshanensis]